MQEYNRARNLNPGSDAVCYGEACRFGATFCGMRARFHPALNAISIGQFALSLRALFRNREWLETHVLKGR